MLRNGIPCCESFEIEMNHNHCCELIMEAVHRLEMHLLCVPEEGMNYLFLTLSNTQQNIIYYCPWCATKLLTNLNKEEEMLVSGNMPFKISLGDSCCNQLKKALYDYQIPLYYEAKVRQYYIGEGPIQTIYYCPWCAFKFPQPLDDAWWDILVNEYHIEDPFQDKRRIPKSFRSDEWWKKRGL